MKKRRAQRSEEWKLKHCARRRLRHSTKILDPDHRAKDAESKRRRREAERTREHKIRKYMSVILTERSLRKKQVVP